MRLSEGHRTLDCVHLFVGYYYYFKFYGMFKGKKYANDFL